MVLKLRGNNRDYVVLAAPDEFQGRCESTWDCSTGRQIADMQCNRGKPKKKVIGDSLHQGYKTMVNLTGNVEKTRWEANDVT